MKSTVADILQAFHAKMIYEGVSTVADILKVLKATRTHEGMSTGADILKVLMPLGYMKRKVRLQTY